MPYLRVRTRHRPSRLLGARADVLGWDARSPAESAVVRLEFAARRRRGIGGVGTDGSRGAALRHGRGAEAPGAPPQPLASFLRQYHRVHAPAGAGRPAAPAMRGGVRLGWLPGTAVRTRLQLGAAESPIRVVQRFHVELIPSSSVASSASRRSASLTDSLWYSSQIGSPWALAASARTRYASRRTSR